VTNLSRDWARAVVDVPVPAAGFRREGMHLPTTLDTAEPTGAG